MAPFNAGFADGNKLGLFVGASIDGAVDGLMVRVEVGFIDGAFDVEFVGICEEALDGASVKVENVGFSEGDREGFVVGSSDVGFVLDKAGTAVIRAPDIVGSSVGDDMTIFSIITSKFVGLTLTPALLTVTDRIFCARGWAVILNERNISQQVYSYGKILTPFKLILIVVSSLEIKPKISMPLLTK